MNCFVQNAFYIFIAELSINNLILLIKLFSNIVTIYCVYTLLFPVRKCLPCTAQATCHKYLVYNLDMLKKTGFLLSKLYINQDMKKWFQQQYSVC